MHMEINPSNQTLEYNESDFQTDESTHATTHKDTGKKAGLKHRLRQAIATWESSIAFWTLLCTIVFAINLIATIFVVVTYGFKAGSGILYRGDCDWVQSAKTWLHFLVNLFSTILLAGSNFCMQSLSAPTRLEVDRAHFQGVTLDVGIPSIRNFKYMRRSKFLLWLLLGFSSLPLHLFYNSTFYYSLKYYRPDVFVGTKPLLKPGPYEFPVQSGDPNSSFSTEKISATHEAATNGSLQRIDPEHCIRAYSQEYISDRSTVILVPVNEDTAANTTNENDTVRSQNASTRNCDSRSTVEWICANIHPETCHKKPCRALLNDVIREADDWRPRGFTVDHCLSKMEVPDCQLLFSLPFAIIVLLTNSSKIVLMLLFLRNRDEDPLLTIGDALQSFLKRQDPWTRGHCLYERSDFRATDFVWRSNPIPWAGRRGRFVSFKGWWKWLLGLIPWLSALIATSTILGWSLEFYKSRSQTVMSVSTLDILQLGLVNPQPQTRLALFSVDYYLLAFTRRLDRTIVTYASIANSPQLVFSLAYYSFNALLTAVLTEWEWSKLPLKGKGLRVSKHPKGDQRHTYFLQLPYRYSIPLLAFSSVIHWLLSQSLYVVALQQNELREQFSPVMNEEYLSLPEEYRRYYDLGWSPLAVLLVIVFATIMILGIGGLCWRRLPTAMPYGANSSLVLAAACHPDWNNEKKGIEYRKLAWGVTSDSFGGDTSLGHCSLSSRHPNYPEIGKLYA